MIHLESYMPTESMDEAVDKLNEVFADTLRFALNDRVLDEFGETETFGVISVSVDEGCGPYIFNEETWEIDAWPGGYNATIQFGDGQETTVTVYDGVSDDPVDQYIRKCKQMLTY